MKKTLYDLLELSPQASPEAIRAAYERLSNRFDPAAAANRENADAAVHQQLVKDAFLTLANPTLRRKYDDSLRTRAALPPAGEVVVEYGGSFWSPSRLLLIVAFLAGGGAYYYKTQQAAAIEQAKLQAAAKQAELEAEQLRQEQAERDRQAAEASRQRAEFERFRREGDMNAYRVQVVQDSQRQRDTFASRQMEREAEAARRREEADARMRAQREIAEARRLDYERAAPRAAVIGR